MKRNKWFEVTFWVSDKYTIIMEAASAPAAIEEAEQLYREQGESAFAVSLTEGGPTRFAATPIAEPAR